MFVQRKVTKRKHTRSLAAQKQRGPLCPSPHRASATRIATVDGNTQTVLAQIPRWGGDVKGFTNAAERRDARERPVLGELERGFKIYTLKSTPKNRLQSLAVIAWWHL